MIAQAVLAPPKPGKAPEPGKFNDNFLKKSSAAAHRPKGKDEDNEIYDDETSELNVAIPGAKKGRKWSKASRKAIRLRLAREAKPVKVELMEVDEDGMLIDELAYNLAVTEGEILDHLYAKGIKPDGVQKLDKEMVKMICREHDVEVIDVGPAKIKEMAKKKEILDADDLDNYKIDHVFSLSWVMLITEKQHFWIISGKPSHIKSRGAKGMSAAGNRCRGVTLMSTSLYTI